MVGAHISQYKLSLKRLPETLLSFRFGLFAAGRVLENPTSVCVGDVRQPAANQANTHDTLDDHPSALNEIEPPNSETASNKSTLSEMLVREVEVEVEEAPPYIPSRSSAPSGANPPHLEISSSPYNIRISPCRVSIELEADELELSGTQQATRGSGTRRNRRDRRGGKRGAWSDWMSMPGVGWVAWRFALTLLVCHAVLVWNQTDDFSEKALHVWAVLTAEWMALSIFLGSGPLAQSLASLCG